MSNIITVTACDNELILLAYQGGGSYEIARILSGNNSGVNVTFNLNTGQFGGTTLLNGVNNALSGSYPITLDSGQYTLLLVGINWGGPAQFAVTVNGTPYTYPGPGGGGVVWTPAVAISV